MVCAYSDNFDNKNFQNSQHKSHKKETHTTFSKVFTFHCRIWLPVVFYVCKSSLKLVHLKCIMIFFTLDLNNNKLFLPCHKTPYEPSLIITHSTDNYHNTYYQVTFDIGLKLWLKSYPSCLLIFASEW